MVLSRLILNPRSRQVRSELADLYELHRTVMKAFAGQSQAGGRVLFRVDLHPHTGVPTLLVQSGSAPNWDFLNAPEKDYLLGADDLPLGVENPGVKPFEVVLQSGQVLTFRLRANPTRKIDREGQAQGRRVGLLREEEQMDWLKRKIEAAGGALLSARVANESLTTGKLYRGAEKHSLQLTSVQFDGTLQVQDPERLRLALEAGIGSGKGFGFGLLSLARAA